MKLSQVEDQAIQARMALIVGAKTFDRLFAGIRFDEIDGPMLYAYAKNEDVASEIEDEFSLHIATVASKIIGREIELVVVMPKVLQ
jgi:chromosomal replication initiation ATPase DnaA